jgi:hypothetical protein
MPRSRGNSNLVAARRAEAETQAQDLGLPRLAGQLDRVEEQHERQHQDEHTRNAVAQALAAPKPHGVVLECSPMRQHCSSPKGSSRDHRIAAPGVRPGTLTDQSPVETSLRSPTAEKRKPRACGVFCGVTDGT